MMCVPGKMCFSLSVCKVLAFLVELLGSSTRKHLPLTRSTPPRTHLSSLTPVIFPVKVPNLNGIRVEPLFGVFPHEVNYWACGTSHDQQYTRTIICFRDRWLRAKNDPSRTDFRKPHPSHAHLRHRFLVHICWAFKRLDNDRSPWYFLLGVFGHTTVMCFLYHSTVHSVQRGWMLARPLSAGQSLQCWVAQHR